MLGRAKKVMIDKDNTTIGEGAGAKTDIQSPPASVDRVDHLRLRAKVRERLAKLAGGGAVIRVGGSTEVGQGEDGAGQRRSACQPGRRRGRHSAGGRRGAAALDQGARQGAARPTTTSAPALRLCAASGVDGSLIVGRLLERDE